MPTDLPGERQLRPSGSMQLDPTGDGLATEETLRLIGSLKVEGTRVFDRSGEELGTISTVMIDKLTGQVAYVVVVSGGLLGIGESVRPLPWKALAYDVELGGYVADDGSTAIAATDSPEPGGVPAA